MKSNALRPKALRGSGSLALALGLSLLATWLCWRQIRFDFVYDEEDILMPVRLLAIGSPMLLTKHGPFVPYFYHAVFEALKPLFGFESDLAALRWLTLFFYALNNVLFWLTSRRWLEDGWSHLALVLFALCPCVFFSGGVGKTEALQFALFFGAILCCLRVAEGAAAGWHALAGVLAAATFGIKFSPTAALAYLACAIMALRATPHASPERRRAARAMIAFAAAFAVSSVVVWFRVRDWLLTYPLIVQSDVYYSNQPAILRAVGEWLAFPYGRYSSALLTTFPMAFGYALYAFALLGIWRARRWPRSLVLTYGLHAAVFLLLALHFTLMRTPHSFTMAAPAVVLAAVLGIRSLRAREARVAAAVVTLGATLYLAPCLLGLYNTFLPLVAEGESALQSDAKTRLLVFSTGDGIPGARERARTQSLGDELSSTCPTALFVSDSLMHNICKYRSDALLIKDCATLHALLDGQNARYRLVSKTAATFRGQNLFFDPDLSLTMYRFACAKPPQSR